ncbi:hypothetical protein [Dietzia sp. 179-F 9C3 NHS]|uniref:hypothetical protein n=1 Tax=Dietzia sp. 179-F 9C3 NHS TaxID=3374295 RepID=UPI003879E979
MTVQPDIPLPGLDFGIEDGQRVVSAPGRTYDVTLSTQAANLAYAVACGRAIGNQPPVLADGRSRAQRSRDVRAAVAEGWDSTAYYRAAGLRPRPTEPVLF